ncbi:type II secretion system F family protein [Burkholderia metallica]|uniref:type II secretion system F family protein n=1 Tax=Burkholderia metallica TaxID=488729 RepID=UPI00157B3990|nr:type II secretion system F family protein [Burkholderia metallica]NTZ88887.1 type II secretion system F family protein [Burkholderia metallica]
MLLFFAILIAVGVMLVSVAVLTSVRGLTQDVVEENRYYKDPLPPKLRLLWPIVNFVAHHFGAFFPRAMVIRAQEQLRITEMQFLMEAPQFVGLCFVSAILCSCISAAVMFAADLLSVPFIPMFAALGFFYPRIWLRDLRKKKIKEIVRQLPVFLDLLTLGVEAGTNIHGAIENAVAKGPEGAMRRELEHVLRDLKSGLGRADALKRMAVRVDVPQVSYLVSAVVQSERMGSGLAATLRFQSEQRRVDRFQAAEKQAMEAPVKLIFPLVMFIFPLTFIVVGFPIAMKFLNEGAM